MLKKYQKNEEKSKKIDNLAIVEQDKMINKIFIAIVLINTNQ